MSHPDDDRMPCGPGCGCPEPSVSEADRVAARDAIAEWFGRGQERLLPSDVSNADEVLAALDRAGFQVTPQGGEITDDAREALRAAVEAFVADQEAEAARCTRTGDLGMAAAWRRRAENARVALAAALAEPPQVTPRGQEGGGLVQFRDPAASDPRAVVSLAPRDAARALLAYQVMLAEAEIQRDAARGERPDDTWSDDDMEPVTNALGWATDGEMLLEHTEAWLYPNADEPHPFAPWPDSPDDCQTCGGRRDDGPHAGGGEG